MRRIENNVLLKRRLQSLHSPFIVMQSACEGRSQKTTSRQRFTEDVLCERSPEQQHHQRAFSLLLLLSFLQALAPLLCRLFCVLPDSLARNSPDKMAQVVNTSTDLNWLLTRNSSSHLLKRRGVSHFFSTDPLNPKGLHKPRFQGTIQKRALTVQENASGKGITLVYKNKRNQNKPAKAISRVPLNRGASRALKNIKQLVNKQNYRSDLKNVSVYLGV